TTAALTNNFLGINPNGAWSLYVQDNVGLDSGAVDGGWSITITPTYSVTNSAAIQFDNLAATNPYPSQMVVSGLPGNIASLTLSLNNLTTNCPPELAIILQGPSGFMVPMSVSGPFCGGTVYSNINLILTDNAANPLPPLGSTLSSGFYKPTSYILTRFSQQPVFPAPAPAGPPLAAPDGTATFASIFPPGTNPNGTWKLFVQSQSQLGPPAGTGQFAGGWTLTFQLQCPAPTNCTVGSSQNPSSFLQAVTFTATVTSGAGTPTGNVTFTDTTTATTLASNVALNGAGQASAGPFTNLSVATHNIVANYSDGITFD